MCAMSLTPSIPIDGRQSAYTLMTVSSINYYSVDGIAVSSPNSVLSTVVSTTLIFSFIPDHIEHQSNYKRHNGPSTDLLDD